MPPYSNVEENRFRQWYGNMANQYGLSPNPYDPQHMYDYKVPYEQGQGPSWQPEHGQFRWPDTGKSPGYDTYQYMQQQLNQNPDLNNYRDAMVQYYQQDPKRLLSLGADFIPGIGQGKGIQEGAMGTDLLTGEPVPTWARVLGLLSALPVIGGVSGVLKDAGKVAKGAKGATDVLAPLKKMSKAKAAYDKAAAAAGKVFGGAKTEDMDKLVEASIVKPVKNTSKMPKQVVNEPRANDIRGMDVERGLGGGTVPFDPETGMYMLNQGPRGLALSPELMEQISKVPTGEKYPSPLTSAILDYIGSVSPGKKDLVDQTKESILNLVEHPDVKKGYIFGGGATDKPPIPGKSDMDYMFQYQGAGPKGNINPHLSGEMMKSQNTAFSKAKQYMPAEQMENPPLHLMPTTGEPLQSYGNLVEEMGRRYGGAQPIRIAGGIPPALLLSELIRRSYGNRSQGTPSQ